MKIGCISWSHRQAFDEGKLDVFSWMEHCKRDARLDGVELWNNSLTSLDKEYLARIKAKAAELGLDIFSVATKAQFGGYSDDEVRKAQQTTRDWMEATAFLGAPVMRLSIGGDDPRDPSHQKTVFASLAEVVREKSGLGLRVGIENQEPGVVQNTADVEAMAAASGGVLGLVLDNGSFLNKADSYPFMEQTLKYAVVVHLKFFDIAPDGSDKVLDYPRIAGIIKGGPYAGYLSIEYDSSQPALRDVPVIASYLRTLL